MDLNDEKSYYVRILIVDASRTDLLQNTLKISRSLADNLSQLESGDQLRATAPIRNTFSEEHIRRMFSPHSNSRSTVHKHSLKRLVVGRDRDYTRVLAALKKHLAKYLDLGSERSVIDSNKKLLGKEDGLFDSEAEFQVFLHEVQDAYDINLKLEASQVKTVKGLGMALTVLFRSAALDTPQDSTAKAA